MKQQKRDDFKYVSKASPLTRPALTSTYEEEALLRYGATWLSQLRLYLEKLEEVLGFKVDSRIPRRKLECFGSNTRGDAVLCCRYLKPQKPPKGVDTPLKCARFVSLLPFRDDWQSFGCANLDVWCTSQEFLDVGAGDSEEHAILLLNFLWWLQIHTAKKLERPDELYLVIGSGIPEGDTCYVMQRPSGSQKTRPDQIVLWNAHAGEAFSAADARCPLVDIGCVVSPTQIWANVQGFTSPSQLAYAFEDATCWRPFYAAESSGDEESSKSCACVCSPGPVQISRPDHLHSVQHQQLLYKEPDVVRAEEIQSALSDELKRRVRRWRAKRARATNARTNFSVDFSRKLQNLLPQLEHAKSEGRPLSADFLQRHAQDALGSSAQWDLDALAFNVVFTDLETLLDRLRATNIHDTQRTDAQFVTGVYVHPLVHRIFSVWVYYGSVCPRRNG